MPRAIPDFPPPEPRLEESGLGRLVGIICSGPGRGELCELTSKNVYLSVCQVRLMRPSSWFRIGTRAIMMNSVLPSKSINLITRSR